MKLIFLPLVVFVFSAANSQVKDSMEEMEMTRLLNESWFENVTGKVLPDFMAKDLNGKSYTNNTVRSRKATFLNFWFVSCAPCIAEIPNLNRLYNMMKDSSDFQFFAITWESEAKAKEAIEKYNIHYPVLLISPNEARQLTFGRGYPTSMVLDKEGKIRSILSGGSSEPVSGFELYWKQEIEKLLKGYSLIEVSKSVHTSGNKSGIVFIDSLLKVQSLDELINYFKGQSLYIDLWASWCLPCRKEFKSKNNSVDSFLNRHKIIPLYLSIDNPKDGEIWKSQVYEYQLTGYHLLAGWKLQEDIKQRIYKNGSTIDVPRYIIVKNGKIVELNAFAPSDGQKLIKQLTEKLL